MGTRGVFMLSGKDANDNVSGLHDSTHYAYGHSAERSIVTKLITMIGRSSFYEVASNQR